MLFRPAVRYTAAGLKQRVANGGRCYGWR